MIVFFSSRRRHTSCALVTGVQTCALPIFLCARTGLGTINHSLLSLEAQRARAIPVAGIAFIGAPHEENERIVPLLGKVPSLGRLPHLDPLDAEIGRAACRERVCPSV